MRGIVVVMVRAKNASKMCVQHCGEPNDVVRQRHGVSTSRDGQRCTLETSWEDREKKSSQRVSPDERFAFI